MHWAYQIFLATSFVLLCEGIFIPFKRSFSTDPDVSRNVVSRSFNIPCYIKSFGPTLENVFICGIQNISDLIYEQRSCYSLSRIVQNNY